MSLVLSMLTVVIYGCCRWKEAANRYVYEAGQLLSELQSHQGALLTEERLCSMAAAREALDKADGAYNAALDQLEVGPAVHNILLEAGRGRRDWSMDGPQAGARSCFRFIVCPAM
jgi:hypothetical protein